MSRAKMDLENEESVVLVLVAAVVVVITTLGVVAKLVVNRTKTAYVSDIKVYPVKSCSPLPGLTEALATDLGFEHDRMAQVSDKAGNYCTPRDKKCVKLFHIQPKLANNNTKSTLTLSAPDVTSDFEIDLKISKTKTMLATPMTGPKVKLQDFGEDVAKWLQTATGIDGARLTAIGAGYQRVVEVNPDQNDALPTKQAPPVSLADEAPYLLTSVSSLADLNKRMTQRGKSPIPMERFRPNLVISGLKPWQEDCLSKVRIGSVEFNVWQRCGRCAMTTIDRSTLERGGEPLATLTTFRERAHGQRNFGMHLIPDASTTGANTVIRIGDQLEILEYDQERKTEWEVLFG